MLRPAFNVFDRANIAVGVALSLVMSCVVIYQIASRYLPIWSAPWSEEAARFLWIWVIALIAGPAYTRRSYVGIDLVPNLLEGRPAWFWLRKCLHVVVALFCAVLMVKGWELASRTTNQSSPALGLNMGLVNVAIAYAGLAMLIAALEALFSPEAPPPGTASEEAL